MISTPTLADRVARIAKLSVRMTAVAGSGHPSSALSLAHIVAYLMNNQMRFEPADPRNPGNDRLVLSEGHAVPAVYAAYADLGGAVSRNGHQEALSIADLDQLRDLKSVLDGHPNPAEGFPFFDAATGSLGQGLSVAAGLALAARNDKIDRRIYCIIGDGEAREGQIWEAVDFIIDYNLTNVCMIFNANGHGQAASVSPQQSAEKLAAKLTAFGCHVEAIDGHDLSSIAAAFENFGKNQQPLAIVAKTVKGWGVDKLLSGNWHGKPLTPDDLTEADASIDRAIATAASMNGAGPAAPIPATPKRVDPKQVEWPTLADALESSGVGGALKKGKLATRRAYGAALKVAGDLIPQVCALDGDVSNSTFSEIFAAAHPDRFYECKIAEQNMVSAAAGLAAAGMIPFANTFAKFFARAYDQIELAIISRANVKLVGSHSGISPCADGPSQMALADVAYFRSFGAILGDDRKRPICWQFQPADSMAAYKLTQRMIAIDGMCYMRTHRPDVPFMYDESTDFVPGGLNMLRTGEDLAIVSSGYALQTALAAADMLAKQGIRAAVIDAYSLPLDDARLIDALQRAGGVAVTVEDNYGGGFGSAVAEAVASHGGFRAQSLHCRRVPKSTRTPEEEFDYCGVSAAQTADHALAFLKRPSGR